MNQLEDLKNSSEILFLNHDLSTPKLNSPDALSIALQAFTNKIEQLPDSEYLKDYLEKWIQEDKVRLTHLDKYQLNEKVLWYFERMLYVLELKLNQLKLSGISLGN